MADMLEHEDMYGQCPCCQKRVRLIEQESLKMASCANERQREILSLRFELAAKGEEYVEPRSRQTRLMVYWACNECLKDGIALLARTDLQRWRDQQPNYAYFDDIETCIRCKGNFIFSKEQQKHRYEDLRCAVYFRPKFCKECDRRRKGRKAVLSVDGETPA